MSWRVGDSSTNTIMPCLTFFPVVVVFCRICVGQVGIGAVALPYSTSFLVCRAALSLLLLVA